MLFCSVLRFLFNTVSNEKSSSSVTHLHQLSKKEFDIDSEETIVLQGFDEEWGEYLDKEEVELLSLKDKTKLRVVLKEKVSIRVLFKKFLFKTLFSKRHFMNCKNSILKARFVLPLATPEIETRNHQGVKLFYVDLYLYHLCLNIQK